MIISKTVKTKISANNFKYFKELGYDLIPLGAPKHGFKNQIIDVRIEHLKPGSNIDVECVCDKCSEHYTQRFCRNTDVCYECRSGKFKLGNKIGTKNKGKILVSMHGENHPRWNPNKSDYNKYASEVRRITNRNKSIYSKWENFDKIGLCGIEGAYQLDHKVSIKYGFYHHIPAEVIGCIDNLEIITWESNRDKSGKSSIDLWDLLK